jgi:diguanylate cyclase (GGDEF)-like protein
MSDSRRDSEPTWLARLRSRLASRLGWRLLAVFVIAAVLPLAVSDWVALSVVSQVVQDLTHDRNGVATRAASRQVLDRLMLSATLLRSIDEAQPAARQRLVASATAAGAPLAKVECVDDAPAAHGGLLARWQHVRDATPMATGQAVALRVEAGPDEQASLLMASIAPSALRCIAVLNPAFVWETVIESSDDSAWVVRSDSGASVYARRGPDAPLPGRDLAVEQDVFTAHLFLAAEFSAANWTFEERAPRGAARWHGMPIGAWLLCVATATLLLIGLVAARTIRQTLRPLDALAEGSRRLAAGVGSTRVDIRRIDELGRLADSFNAMAAQLEERIAALRALADLDAGILAGAGFADLAGRVLRRLAGSRPSATFTVAWRADDGLVHVLGLIDREAGFNSRAVEFVEADAAKVGQFEAARDGLVDPSEPGPGGCRIWTARDGDQNRALIRMVDREGAPDLQEARDLRDRLAVAIVARDREFQLQHRASHDLLTGLRNPYGLQLALAPLLAQETSLALLFIDLDHFKDINDCYGHAVGDRLLQAAARRLERAAPAGALLSRNGGDEFVVILPGARAPDAQAAAARLLESLAQPFILTTNEHRSSASIGIAIHPDHGVDREELLRCADIALYEAKGAGRGRWALFKPTLDARLRERNDLLTGLDRALARSEFVVHYQPRLHAETGAVVAAEALVRWQHPERGLTLPAMFIELAESSGRIDALGRVVMASAIAQLAEWRCQGLAIGRLSVNVSQHQFESGTLVAHVQELLARHEVDGSQLEIEVTESVLGGDVASVRQQLHELRALGATIAMDDFGTGYSSLSQLRTLPINVMKIDRAFVKDLESASDAVAIARTIVTLARALGLKVVAEGIETSAQAGLLAEMGCDEFQGFLFSKAVPAAEFAAFARARVPAPRPRASATRRPG